MNIDIEIDATDVEKLLINAERALSPVGVYRFMSKWAPNYFQNRAVDSFGSQADRATGPWAPLSAATIDIRERLGYGSGPINKRTGELREWLTSSPGNTYLMGSEVIFYFPSLAPPSYAAEQKLHTAQLGRAGSENPMIPGGSSPARPVTSIDAQDVVQFMAGFATHLEETIRLGGLI